MGASASTRAPTRDCPYCRETVNADALKCRHCGENVWSRRTAALLSLVVPGAGQVYKGQFGCGLWFMLVILAGYVLTVDAPFLLPPFAFLSTVLVCHFAVVVDAATAPVRVPAESEHRWSSLTWQERLVVAFLVLFFAAVFAYAVVMIAGS